MIRRLTLPLALVACGGAQDDDTSVPAGLCGDLEFKVSEFAGSSYVATWTSEVAGTPTITLELNGTTWTYTSEASGTEHSAMSTRWKNSVAPTGSRCTTSICVAIPRPTRLPALEKRCAVVTWPP